MWLLHIYTPNILCPFPWINRGLHVHKDDHCDVEVNRPGTGCRGLHVHQDDHCDEEVNRSGTGCKFPSLALPNFNNNNNNNSSINSSNII